MRFLLFGLLFLFGCRLGGHRFSSERLDTVRNNAYTVTVHPLILETAFFEGTTSMGHTISGDSALLRFCPIHIGDLLVTSGRVIDGCPVTVTNAIPISVDFPVGVYPVQLAIARHDDDERVAFSRILFSPNPVARWEVAVDRGQAPLPLSDTSVYGYGVDGGVGLFIDSAANALLNADRILDSTVSNSVFMYGMKAHNHGGWDYGIYRFSGVSAKPGFTCLQPVKKVGKGFADFDALIHTVACVGHKYDPGYPGQQIMDPNHFTGAVAADAQDGWKPVLYAIVPVERFQLLGLVQDDIFFSYEMGYESIMGEEKCVIFG